MPAHADMRKKNTDMTKTTPHQQLAPNATALDTTRTTTKRRAARTHKSLIVWHEVTRNCHVGKLEDVPVVVVERLQKHRSDGTKHDWQVVVLGDRYTWNKTFCQHDQRDLDSTKSAAEARIRWAIECLYRALKAKP